MLHKQNGLSKLLKQFFLLIIILLAGNQVIIAQNNFNGGFETKSIFKSEPVGWYATRLPQTEDFVVFEWDSTEYYSGNYSVSIYIKQNHPQDEVAYNWTRTLEEFTIGEKYIISGWVKTLNCKETAWIVVQCWDANQKIIGFATNQHSNPVKGTTDWTLVKSDFTVPEGTKEVRIRIGIASPKDNGGKVWFDDIKIE
jgi:hypothetical protein